VGESSSEHRLLIRWPLLAKVDPGRRHASPSFGADSGDWKPTTPGPELTNPGIAQLGPERRSLISCLTWSRRPGSTLSHPLRSFLGHDVAQIRWSSRACRSARLFALRALDQYHQCAAACDEPGNKPKVGAEATSHCQVASWRPAIGQTDKGRDNKEEVATVITRRMAVCGQVGADVSSCPH